MATVRSQQSQSRRNRHAVTQDEVSMASSDPRNRQDQCQVLLDRQGEDAHTCIEQRREGRR